MKQLTDEVLAQVRDALEMNRVMAQDSDGNYTRDCTPKKITAALAALDTAQPVQVNAMLVEALTELMPKNICVTNRHWSDATVVPLDVTLGELRKANAAITAAQQAQPERGSSDADCDRAYRNGLKAGFSFGLEGNEEGFRKSMESYQREIAAHGIKQGGQQ